VVPNPYTVIHPLTMMIKSLHTTITNIAMPRFSSTHDLTCRTEHVWIKLLNKPKKAHFIRLFEIARVLKPCEQEEDVYCYE
jgi:hypothetical protein